jgi:von Willebrand factor type A domain
VDGRDSIGAVTYGFTVELTLPLTDHFQPDAADRISKIKCGGSTNTAEALEVARQELLRANDPEAINVVILFTDGGSGTISANWTLRDPAERWCGQPGFCGTPPACRDLPRTDPIPAIGFPWFGMNTTDIRGIEFIAHPAIGSAAATAADAKTNQCIDTHLGGPIPFAFLPEKDIAGVPFTGSRPLERFTDGPYAGKIRLNLGKNVLNAGANQMDNVASLLHGSGPYIYVIGFESRPGTGMESLDYFKRLANDPSGASFDRDLPAGLTIATDNVEDFWPAFQRIRQEIIKQATVK